jgi:hypothetical protein
VSPIRIVLAETPSPLRSLVREALAGEPDLVVVVDTDDEVAALLHAGHADVVLVGMSGGVLPAVAERLLDEYPRVGVVAVDLDRGHGLLYRLRPELSRIEAITPDALVEAIRRAAAEIAA